MSLGKNRRNTGFPTETPWIVTLSGRILRPREIQDLIRTLERD